MRTKLNFITIFILFLLGAAHVILTPMFYEAFDLNTLWFVGAGLAFIYLSIINFCGIKSKTITIKSLCLVANVAGFIYSIFIVIKLSEPQAYISLIILLFLLGLSFADLKILKRSNLTI